MITKIDSRANPRLKRMVSQKEDWLFLEGEKLIRDVIQKGVYIDILVINSKLGEKGAGNLADNPSIGQIWIASELVLKKLSELKSLPDYIGLLKPPGSVINPSEARCVFAFCDLQDPGNAGSIFRCAAAFGIRDIAFIGDCVKVTNRKFIRVAQNSIFEINYARYSDMNSFLDSFGGLPFNVYLTSSKPATKVYLPGQVKMPAVIIFGSEGRGIAENLFNLYPTVRIPQSQKIDSLNLGISACIIMHELSKAHDLL
jgi:TrmH family RNA methyltransferase